MNTNFDRSLARRAVGALAMSLAAAALCAPTTAFAQDEKPAAGATAGGTDHASVVGKMAVGWMGVNSVPIGVGDYATSVPGGKCGVLNPGQTQVDTPCRPVLNGRDSVLAPTIGVRYWMSEKMGLDIGLGLGITSGSTKSYPYPSEPQNGGFDVEDKRDKESRFAAVIHAGVPLVVGEPGKHYVFQVIPEANIGFSSGTRKDQNPPPNPANPNPVAQVSREDFKTGGFRLDLGARAGAEIHFGFMGIPQLALQGTVGLYVSMDSVRASVGGKDATDSNTSIGTSVQQAPWAIFTNNIAALYYF